MIYLYTCYTILLTTTIFHTYYSICGTKCDIQAGFLNYIQGFKTASHEYNNFTVSAIRYPLSSDIPRIPTGRYSGIMYFIITILYKYYYYYCYYYIYLLLPPQTLHYPYYYHYRPSTSLYRSHQFKR